MMQLPPRREARSQVSVSKDRSRETQEESSVTGLLNGIGKEISEAGEDLPPPPPKDEGATARSNL